MGGLERAERVVTFAAFLVLIAAVFGDVVSREITGTGLHWARQVGVFANLPVIMFGIGLASATGTHLRPRFADGWLPGRWSGALNRLQDAGMAVFCSVFAFFAGLMAFEGYMLAERSAALDVAVWPFQAVIPLAFGIATLRHGFMALYPALRPVTEDTGGTA